MSLIPPYYALSSHPSISNLLYLYYSLVVNTWPHSNPMFTFSVCCALVWDTFSFHRNWDYISANGSYSEHLSTNPRNPWVLESTETLEICFVHVINHSYNGQFFTAASSHFQYSLLSLPSQLKKTMQKVNETQNCLFVCLSVLGGVTPCGGQGLFMALYWRIISGSAQRYMGCWRSKPWCPHLQGKHPYMLFYHSRPPKWIYSERINKINKTLTRLMKK